MSCISNEKSTCFDDSVFMWSDCVPLHILMNGKFAVHSRPGYYYTHSMHFLWTELPCYLQTGNPTEAIRDDVVSSAHHLHHSLIPLWPFRLLYVPYYSMQWLAWMGIDHTWTDLTTLGRLTSLYWYRNRCNLIFLFANECDITDSKGFLQTAQCVSLTCVTLTLFALEMCHDVTCLYHHWWFLFRTMPLLRKHWKTRCLSYTIKEKGYSLQCITIFCWSY